MLLKSRLPTIGMLSRAAVGRVVGFAFGVESRRLDSIDSTGPLSTRRGTSRCTAALEMGMLLVVSKEPESARSVMLVLEFECVELPVILMWRSFMADNVCGVTGLGRPDMWLLSDGEVLNPEFAMAGDVEMVLRRMNMGSDGACTGE